MSLQSAQFSIGMSVCEWQTIVMAQSPMRHTIVALLMWSPCLSWKRWKSKRPTRQPLYPQICDHDKGRNPQWIRKSIPMPSASNKIIRKRASRNFFNVSWNYKRRTGTSGAFLEIRLWNNREMAWKDCSRKILFYQGCLLARCGEIQKSHSLSAMFPVNISTPIKSIHGGNHHGKTRPFRSLGVVCSLQTIIPKSWLDCLRQ